MRQTSDYVALITPQHTDKPKFVATVSASVDPLAQLQATLLELEIAFDLDTAVGAQLDAVGVRVSRSRQLRQALPNLYFTWGDPNRGWGRGVWKGPYDTSYGITLLDDDTYRRLLKAKVLANAWDGTVAGEQGILDAYFVDPATHVFVEDGAYATLNEQWFTWNDPLRGWGQGVWKPLGATPSGVTRVSMQMTVGVSGKIPSLVDLGLLGQDLIAARPMGVEVNYRVTSVDGAPVFGWGVDNQYIGGWGRGAWGVTPDYVIANPV